MKYYMLNGDKTRRYALKIGELRKAAFQWLAFQEGNMEMAILIFREDGKIAEKCYLNYGAGNRCYLFRQVSTGPRERTFRSYFTIEGNVPYIISDKPDVRWIEIPTLVGKQVTMTGGWL